jgi:thymidylate synthase ThyX
MIKQDEQGYWIYEGDTFTIRMTRYSDPDRKNLARNAARYLGKSDIENIRRPLSVIKKGHVGEIFRGEHVEFEFIDVSKEVYDHIITYTTRNMRVAGGNRALTSDDWVRPSDKIKDVIGVDSMIESSMDNYKKLLQSGETPQVSRSAMPVAAKMNIFVYQFNFLTLGQSVFAQRVWDKGAQGNTVKVIDGMLKLCENIDKELWDTFYKYMGTPSLRWKEVGRKLEIQHVTVHQLLNELHLLALAGEGDPDESLLDYLDRKYGDIKTMW